MQVQVTPPAVSVHHRTLNSCSRSELDELDDFSFKLRLSDDNNDNSHQQQQVQEQQHKEDEEQEEEEEEFSFCCLNPDGSPISADDIFHNGQIRSVFPLFNRDLLFSDDEDSKNPNSSGRSSLKKLFVEAEEPEGPFCEWTGKAVETSPEVCKKSNSTGFSKLRRFRELVLRSNSDGKDAFVFFNHHHHHNSNNNSNNKAEKSEKVAVLAEEKKVTTVKTEDNNNKKKKRGKTASSVHERLYVRNKAIKEEHKRKSYLPYRVGFFTNVNGLSTNVHPY